MWFLRFIIRVIKTGVHNVFNYLVRCSIVENVLLNSKKQSLVVKLNHAYLLKSLFYYANKVCWWDRKVVKLYFNTSILYLVNPGTQVCNISTVNISNKNI